MCFAIPILLFSNLTVIEVGFTRADYEVREEPNGSTVQVCIEVIGSFERSSPAYVNISTEDGTAEGMYGSTQVHEY